MSISIPHSGQLPARPAETPAAHTQAGQPQAAQAAGAPVAPKVKAPDAAQMREELSQAIERLNEQMRKQGRDLSFSMDEVLNRTVVQVKDANTGEVVRQIPNETVLKVAHSIEDFKGLLLNQRS